LRASSGRRKSGMVLNFGAGLRNRMIAN